MSIKEVGTQARQYLLIAAMLAVAWFISDRFNQNIGHALLATHEGGRTLFILFGIVIVFTLGFIVYELSKPTIFPSFVLAVFFGIATRDILSPLTSNPTALTTLITIGAVLILFGGGLETPFQKFRDLIGPILSLAVFGTILNAFLLSLLIVSLSGVFGLGLPVAAAVLLGCAIASTDPAAIIPSFQSLFFTRPRVKHIAISESAINDVVGAVLATTFLSLFISGKMPRTVLEAFNMLLNWENVAELLQAIFIGAGVGIIGFGILHLWSAWKSRVQTEEGTDAALFLGVPLFAYTLSQVLGGSGFLAVFVASLLFRIRVHFRHVEHYFNHTIEGFMKPMIFMLLGAMTDPAALWSIAPTGIAAGLLFMFVLRPLTVFLSLLPFCYGRCPMEMRELLFLSFVRETGVIPAALLIAIRVAGIPGSDILMPLGLWIILLTLVIEPPLTPVVARKLAVAKPLPPLPERKHRGPVAVLCSRGFSFPKRMETVVEWAEEHGVENVILLHCPEEKYSTSFVSSVRTRASNLFASMNKQRESEGKHEMNFEFLCGAGLLQDNIESLIAEGDVSIIFVGAKMLDYRLDDVKRLNVPFFFMA